MSFFSKRETPAQNISLLAMSVASITALAILSSFVPFSTIFVMLAIPFLAAVTVYLCRDIYVLAFVPAAFAVALGSTFYDLSNTIFYVLPAILSGTLVGFGMKKNVPMVWLLLGASLLQVGLDYLAILLVKALYSLDIINDALSILGLTGKDGIKDIIPLFMYALGLVEASLSSIFILVGFDKIGSYSDKRDNRISYVVAGSSSIVAVVMAMSLIGLIRWFSYFLLGVGIYLSIASSYRLFRKNPWWVFAILAFLLAVSVFIFAFFYSRIDPKDAPILFGAFPLSLSLTSLIRNLLLFHREEKEGEDESA